MWGVGVQASALCGDVRVRVRRRRGTRRTCLGFMCWFKFLCVLLTCITSRLFSLAFRRIQTTCLLRAAGLETPSRSASRVELICQTFYSTHTRILHGTHKIHTPRACTLRTSFGVLEKMLTQKSRPQLRANVWCSPEDATLAFEWVPHIRHLHAASPRFIFSSPSRVSLSFSHRSKKNKNPHTLSKAADLTIVC